MKFVSYVQIILSIEKRKMLISTSSFFLQNILPFSEK